MDINGGTFSDLIRHTFGGTQPPVEFSARRALGDLPLRFAPKPPWKPASVLLPLVTHAETPTVLLTRRTDRLQDHAGQVSFPGGSWEPRDATPVETALREAQEEIGLSRDHVEVVGYLPGYLTVTGYAVTPVLSLVRPGFTLRIDPLEVAEVFEVPLTFLADPLNRRVEKRELAGHDVGYYVFDYERHRIWGATAAMLVNFLDSLVSGGAA